MCEIIDTFPAFLKYWARVQGDSIGDKVERWAVEYLSPWPELRDAQIENYSSAGLDWRQIARDKVFPYLTERLPAMQEARRNLWASCAPVYARTRQLLAFEERTVFVIYVGIGCGAGWATTFCGSPAILFGLENIAECGWNGSEAIAGLIAHELAHLAHHHWRGQVGIPVGSGPWWQLYEEGFAQYCESLILHKDRWHRTCGGNTADWLDWCYSHQPWLAGEFLRRADAGEPVAAFFGSWFEIRGRSETGYFLGCAAITELTKRLDLKEIALLEDVEVHLRPLLEQMATSGA